MTQDTARASRLPLLLAPLLGALAVAGFAPYELYPLPILSLAGIFLLWRAAPNARCAAWLGLLWGWGFFLCGISWVFVSLHIVGGMFLPLALLSTLMFCTLPALYPALAGALFRRFLTGRPVADALLAAALWMLCEWLRGWLLTGFPWLASGYAQTPPSPLAGYAAVMGSYGITLMAALLSGLLAFCLHDVGPRIRIAALLAALTLIVGGALLTRIHWTQPTGAPISVTLLQGNIPQESKWDADRLKMSLDVYERLAQSHPAQLRILPETALPMFVHEIPPAFLAMLMDQGPTITGAANLIYASGKPRGYTNVALALEHGRAFQYYAKTHLVPFGEYIPAGFAWLIAQMEMPMSDFSPGAKYQSPLEIAGQKIAANICYEDLFGEEIIRALPQATLLVNLSNTAWFGDSLMQPQHLQIARMRALETGRVMLRSTNTGMTAAIQPDGQVSAVLPAFTAAALTVQAQGYSGSTPYVRWGNTLALLLAILALLPALRWRRNPPPAPSASP